MRKKKFVKLQKRWRLVKEISDNPFKDTIAAFNL